MNALSTPAFPSIEGPGMTLREHAAIQIAAGIAANQASLRTFNGEPVFRDDDREFIVEAAFEIADAVIDGLTET